MQMELKMDMKLGLLILLNMAPPQKLVLAPSAIFRENSAFLTVDDIHVTNYTYLQRER